MKGPDMQVVVAHVQKRVPNEVTRFLLSYDYI